ncbi:MAG: S46 family peptidase [Holophagaceae bacterium]
MRLTALAAALVLAAAPLLQADEGMWTFDNVPVKAIQAKYGVDLGPAWLKNLQLATLRFPNGTGAFVSRDGLVITNHHVGRDAIAQVSSAKADYVRDGFTAATRAQEIKVPGLELMMLVSSEDVTARVNAAVKPGMADKDALTARRNALAELRKAEEARTGLTCEPVTLYQGGEYWLYRYRKFKDVRLAAAPEVQVASFGGDPDNYTYPRWNLDFALFRVYEDGKPYKPRPSCPSRGHA